MRLRRTHRFAGLLGLLLFAGIAVTGIALNHADRLGLPHSRVQNPWILKFYGIGTQRIERGFAVGPQWLSAVGNDLYLDDQPLSDATGLTAAVFSQGLIVIADDQGLALFLPDGQLVERLSEDLPAALTALGTDRQGQLVARTPGGDWIADAELLTWRPYSGETSWNREQPLPAQLAARLGAKYYGRGPNWERVILDLHSGRLFGRYGWLLSDLAAVLILVLGGSGLWSWNRQRRRRRNSSCSRRSLTS